MIFNTSYSSKVTVNESSDAKIFRTYESFEFQLASFFIKADVNLVIEVQAFVK